ncbi:MAG: hypothetical protein J3K34DRAFT_455625 [Monoraphidium minutum]|nr:MAG: hypothetical protein J3K34DRAFT_455625 [Monoraphidium minutum]
MGILHIGVNARTPARAPAGGGKAASRTRCAASNAARCCRLHAPPQDWIEAAEEGHAALAGIHPALEELQAPTEEGRGEPPAALAALSKLAPSFALERYVSSLGRPKGAAAASSTPSTSTAAAAAAAGPLPADELSSHHQRLTESVERLRRARGGMAAACEAHATAALARPAGAAPRAAACGGGTAPEPGAAEGAAGGGDNGGEDGGGDNRSSSSSSGGYGGIELWGQEELGLLLASQAAAVDKATDWMAKAAAAVSLAAPAAEVETYAELWGLRPGWDEEAADALIDAVLAAQRRREGGAGARGAGARGAGA